MLMSPSDPQPPPPMFAPGFLQDFFFILEYLYVIHLHVVYYPDILCLTEHGGDRGYAGGIWHHFFDRFSPR